MAQVTAPLAEFLVRAKYEDVPEAVRLQAKRVLLNSMAASLGGANNDVIQKFVETLARVDAVGPVRVVGRSERLSLPDAAFINGAAAAVLDFCDTHFPTIMHPTAAIAGALYAIADKMPVTGKEFLHAFILGFETSTRIGLSISPYHYAHGFHITSTCGVFGSSVAIARLLKLDVQRMVWAIGNASTQSAGMVKACGFESKSIGVGNAARSGLLASFYAQADLDAPPQSLEGKFGYCEVMSPTPNYAAIIDGLGDVWQFDNNAFKAYPAGIVIHPIIDACLQLRSEFSIKASDVAKFTVYGHPLVDGLTGRPVVSTVREAVVSIQHSVAVAFVDGEVGLRQYELDRINDPQVIGLRNKVSVVQDEAMPVGPIRCALITTQGKRHEVEIQHWLGSLQRPLNDEQIREKLRQLAVTGAPHCDPEPVIDLMTRLEDVDDVSKLVAATRP